VVRARWVSLISATAITLSLVAPVSAATPTVSEPGIDSPQTAAEPPNVLLIVTDDQRAGTEVGMPTVMSEIAAKGTQYSRAFVPTSSCCPSRASLLSGKFAHNSGVWDNTTKSAWGAWAAFARGGEEADTLATRLQDGGYHTGLFGKYLNGAERKFRKNDPPGWDSWVAFLKGNYVRYRLSTDQHQVLKNRTYLTDALADDAVKFINSAPAEQPLFTFFAPYAPHYPFDAGPYTGSARSAGVLNAVRAAADFPSPATNQADMSGYPQWMQSIKPSDRWIGSSLSLNEMVERQADMLMGVDRAISRMLDALRDSGRLDNTLVIFTSDNGFAWGDHRLQRKNTPYDSSVRVPLIMRFDDRIAPGTRDSRVVAANVDLYATILEAAGIESGQVDGVSTLSSTREGLVMESTSWLYRKGQGRRWTRPAYCGYRTASHLFVRYSTGEEELYDYTRDPYELVNLADQPAHESVRQDLESQARAACSPTPPGFTWDDDVLPLQPPSHVKAQYRRDGRVIITWRAADNVGTALPEYHVYVGSVTGKPACIRGSKGLAKGLHCRIERLVDERGGEVTVVSVRGEETAAAPALDVIPRS
jgi:N-acetylglucosamine-6-sulfatase